MQKRRDGGGGGYNADPAVTGGVDLTGKATTVDFTIDLLPGGVWPSNSRSVLYFYYKIIPAGTHVPNDFNNIKPGDQNTFFAKTGFTYGSTAFRWQGDDIRVAADFPLTARFDYADPKNPTVRVFNQKNGATPLKESFNPNGIVTPDRSNNLKWSDAITLTDRDMQNYLKEGGPTASGTPLRVAWCVVAAANSSSGESRTRYVFLGYMDGLTIK